MAYKGWTYHSEYEHDDGDVRKLDHWVTHEDGRRVDLPFSPYNSRVRPVSIEAIIELGFPSTSDLGTMGSLDETILLDAYIQHLKRKQKET